MLYPILALLFAGPSLSTEDPNGSQAVCGNPVTPITPRSTNPQKLTDFIKLNSLTLQTVLMTWTLAACGQGTMIYDQQSATNRSISGGAPIQEEQPIGQSFTPALSSVGFVQFEFIDAHPGNGMGATVYVNLRTDSLTGSILDSTAPVFMPDGFSYGITSFFFATPAGVSPGTTYYLQPVVQSGDGLWGMIVGTYNYSDGTFFANGVPNSPGFDAWFREGVIIPEPSSGLLALAGVAAIWVAGRVRQVRARYLATLLIGLLASAGVASA